MSESIEIVAMGRGDETLGDGLAMHRSTAETPARPQPHAHGFHQVTLFLTSPGRMEWQFGSTTEVGRPGVGDIAVCPALVPLAARWERPFDAVSIRLAPDRLSRVAAIAGLDPRTTVRPVGMRRDSFLREVLGKLADAPLGPAPGRRLLADALGTALGLHLLGEYQFPAASTDQGGVGGLPAPALARVQAYVEAHLTADLSVDRLASLVGLGRFDFIRRFRAATGTTPHQYVLQQRVEAARRSILAGGGIADAALAAGFASQSHFHGHCRRLLGVTPGDLTREARPIKPPPR